ncbi:MAG: DUF1638 domain-containing protein [Pontiellaceae bacterium]|nr:DUF1638 domain-containing protein [Pontiellaceae bacterium]
MSALAGKPVDRPPVLAVLGAYGGRLAGIPLPELYTQADRYVAGQQAVLETFPVDIALAPFDFSAIAEAFGGSPVFFDHQPPNMKRPGFFSAQAVLETPLPDAQTAARLPFILEATRKLAALYQKSVPVCGVIPGPAALPALLLGMERWLETALFEAETAARVMEYTGTFWTAWANALLEAGADVLIVTEGMATQQICTRELFVERFLPHVKTRFSTAGPLIFHHAGGSIQHIADLIPTLPNLAGVCISAQDNLSAFRKMLGPDLPLLGNIDSLDLPNISLEKLVRRTRESARIGAENAPFILCTSSADIPLETPPETLHAFFRAASEGLENTPLWVVCSVLEKEIQALKECGNLEGEILNLSSRLHMDPPKLEQTLRRVLDDNRRPVILVYGDCCPAMLQFEQRPNVARVEGINCCQMLLGKNRYRELMHEEAFMLLPEWAQRWKEVIEQDLNLKQPVAQDLLQDSRKKLVYLDTGLSPIPQQQLKECSDYTGLSIEIEKTGTDELLARLRKAEQTCLSKMSGNQLHG